MLSLNTPEMVCWSMNQAHNTHSNLILLQETLQWQENAKIQSLLALEVEANTCKQLQSSILSVCKSMSWTSADSWSKPQQTCYCLMPDKWISGWWSAENSAHLSCSVSHNWTLVQSQFLNLMEHLSQGLASVGHLCRAAPCQPCGWSGGSQQYAGQGTAYVTQNRIDRTSKMILKL